MTGSRRVRSSLDGPHHDGGPLHVEQGQPALGDEVPVRVRVPAHLGEVDVVVRTVRDGEPAYRRARPDGADDVVAYLREVPGERVLVLASRAPWDGAALPRDLAGPAVETWYGPDLAVDDAGLHLPGVGPAVGVWRVA